MLGFNPAAPSNTPRICTLAENWIPFDAGMQAAPSMQEVSASAVAAAATGAFTGTKLDGTNRVFVGTDTKLYELQSGAMVDVSQSASAYVSGSVWSFCQFGDATLASNYGNAIQASTSSSFGAIAGAPKAKFIESVVTGAGGFVFAANTNDAGFGVSPDRWWCSAINDHTDWTISTATQSNSGRLVGGGGPIVGLKAFGADSIVVYKQNALYHARYVGGEATWQFTEVPEVGAVGARAMCDIGYAHFIVSPNGFWVYDGARPIRVGAEVRQWFLDNADFANISATECLYDVMTNRVFVFWRSAGASGLNRALVWHVGTQQWGVAHYSIETALFYVPPGTTYAQDAGTYAAAVGTYDSEPQSKRVIAAFNTSHKLTTLTGSPSAWKFQTGDKGDPVKASRLTESYLSYAVRPLSAQCAAYASSNLGGVELTGPTSVAYDVPGGSQPGRFTLRQHARWHRLEYSGTGACSVIDEGAKLTPAGGR